jgi:hypothetical protein
MEEEEKGKEGLEEDDDESAPPPSGQILASSLETGATAWVVHDQVA